MFWEYAGSRYLMACLQILPAHGGSAATAYDVHECVQASGQVLMARLPRLFKIYSVAREESRLLCSHVSFPYYASTASHISPATCNAQQT